MTKSHHIKLLFTLFCLVMLSFSSDAQNEQDCFGAIPVCNGFYNQTESYSGTGDMPNELPGGFNDCLSIDANSVWYTFTIETDGDLSFVLTPNSANADYDWMVFDFSTGNCDDISSDSDFIVSCNSYGNFGENGPTGISTALGGEGNSNGPGNANGPEFNADLPVSTGETYLLYIQDWSGSTEGYTLDFTGATASIFDNDAPEISSVEHTCEGDLVIQFSENIDCANIALADFLVNTSAGSVAPNSLTSNCSDNESSTNSITLSFLDTPGFSLPLDEDMFLEIVGTDGLLTDLCGNAIEDLTFSFSTVGAITFTTENTDAECGEANGEINVINLLGGSAPYSYSTGGPSQELPVFQNVAGGLYIVTVTDLAGCSGSELVSVDEFSAITINAGTDDTSCSLSYTLSAEATENTQVEWTPVPGITFSDVTDINATVTASSSGTFTLELTSNQNGCDASDEVEISFSNLENTFDNILTSCSENCSGEINVNSISGLEPITYTLNGANLGTNTSSVNLCSGAYEHISTDALGCTSTDSFTITSIQSPELTSVEVSDVNCIDGCDGSIEITADASYTIFSPQGEFDEATGTFFNLCAGLFTYTVVNSNNCATLFSETITTQSSLNAALTISPNPVELSNAIVEFTDLSSGDPVSSELIIITESELSFDVGSITDFSGHEGTPLVVQLIVQDALGCIDSEEYTIDFITPLVIFIPNAFSPNNDGLNEGFIPVASGLDLDEYEFIIFDRWGNELFTSVDSTEPWRGNVNQGDYYVSPGTYSYSLKVKQRFLPNYEEFFGSIQVVR